MKKYTRKIDAISSKLQEEQVILDIEKGKYFSLNPVATLIWEILEQELSIESICEKLLDEYDVESERCKQETNAYMQEMIKLGLITEV
jgi:hypothetical protein